MDASPYYTKFFSNELRIGLACLGVYAKEHMQSKKLVTL